MSSPLTVRYYTYRLSYDGPSVIDEKHFGSVYSEFEEVWSFDGKDLINRTGTGRRGELIEEIPLEHQDTMPFVNGTFLVWDFRLNCWLRMREMK